MKFKELPWWFGINPIRELLCILGTEFYYQGYKDGKAGLPEDISKLEIDSMINWDIDKWYPCINLEKDVWVDEFPYYNEETPRTWVDNTKGMSQKEKDEYMAEHDLVELGNGQIVGRTGAFTV